MSYFQLVSSMRQSQVHIVSLRWGVWSLSKNLPVSGTTLNIPMIGGPGLNPEKKLVFTCNFGPVSVRGHALNGKIAQLVEFFARAQNHLFCRKSVLAFALRGLFEILGADWWLPGQSHSTFAWLACGPQSNRHVKRQYSVLYYNITMLSKLVIILSLSLNTEQ